MAVSRGAARGGPDWSRQFRDPQNWWQRVHYRNQCLLYCEVERQENWGKWQSQTKFPDERKLGTCWLLVVADVEAQTLHIHFSEFLKSIFQFNNLPLALYSLQITPVVLSSLHLSTQFGNSYGIFTVWLFTLLAVVAATVWPQVHDEAIDYHFSALGHDSTDWVPVELELVDRLWIPDAEILRLKGFT